ncbi:MAG: response regulator [Anaerolineae bacterium]|nr:response regulator [Anaerolineae bacterium]
MRIVYVEDNVANIALLERICNMGKDELITYLDAGSALSEIRPGLNDLIVIDLHLGNQSIDGLELARLLRERGVNEPIVAITSYDHIYEKRSELAGCNEYVKKPVSVPMLVKLFERYRSQ